MNPTVRVGRYEFPIENALSVASVAPGRFARLWAWITGRIPAPRYDVALVGGFTIRMNEEEKAALDTEREHHAATLQVLGMVATLQRNSGLR